MLYFKINFDLLILKKKMSPFFLVTMYHTKKNQVTKMSVLWKIKIKWQTYSRLKEIREAWQQNAVCILSLDSGLK